MPTGYTDAIAKGASFNAFVWSCARAFGALVTMRDNAHDAPIPERFEPSDYNAKRLAEARAERERIVGMTNDGADRAAAEEYEKARESYEKRLAEKAERRASYNAMLAKVRAWTPPSKEHEGLKDFMEEQITKSIDWDCDTRYMDKPELLTGSRWRKEHLSRLDHDLQYHHDENAKEVARAEQRNAWLAALRASVPPSTDCHSTEKP